jgi:hypothetical protein
MPIRITIPYSTGSKGLGVRKREKEHQRREAADHADEQLDHHEAGHHTARDVARQPAADAHREQVRADDGRELRDTVAEQIRRERAGDQLVNQPTGRDEADGNKERGIHRISVSPPLR